MKIHHTLAALLVASSALITGCASTSPQAVSYSSSQPESATYGTIDSIQYTQVNQESSGAGTVAVVRLGLRGRASLLDVGWISGFVQIPFRRVCVLEEATPARRGGATLFVQQKSPHHRIERGIRKGRGLIVRGARLIGRCLIGHGASREKGSTRRGDALRKRSLPSSGCAMVRPQADRRTGHAVRRGRIRPDSPR